MKNKDKKKQVIHIKICLFGDNNEIENKSREKVIRDFLPNYKPVTNKSTGPISPINYDLNNVFLEIEVHEITEINERSALQVKDSQIIFIIFNMDQELSFTNLLDKWLIWLRDTCQYKNSILILGDYNLTEKNFIRSEEDVNDMIECSEMECTFKIIGNSSSLGKKKIIEEYMISQINNKINTKNSQKNKNCCIY